jgi:hypothetical protein
MLMMRPVPQPMSGGSRKLPWFAARMTPPAGGTFSAPNTRQRKYVAKIARKMIRPMR